MRKKLQKYKYPLMCLAIMSTCVALTHLYGRLGLCPPASLTITLFAVAVASDYGTTVKTSRMGGKEGNPFVGLLFKKIRPEIGGLFVLAFFALAIIFVFDDMPTHQQLAFGCAYWMVPINNLLVMRRLRKSKARA